MEHGDRNRKGRIEHKMLFREGLKKNRFYWGHVFYEKWGGGRTPVRYKDSTFFPTTSLSAEVNENIFIK